MGTRQRSIVQDHGQQHTQAVRESGGREQDPRGAARGAEKGLFTDLSTTI
jgi:hypothetical protein